MPSYRVLYSVEIHGVDNLEEAQGAAENASYHIPDSTYTTTTNHVKKVSLVNHRINDLSIISNEG